jgi:hypothetical protein
MLEVKLEEQPQEQAHPSEIKSESVESKAAPSVTRRPPLEDPIYGAVPNARKSGGVNILIGACLGAIAVLLYLNYWPMNRPQVSSQIQSTSPATGERPAAQETSPAIPPASAGKHRSEIKPVQTAALPEANPNVALLPCAQGISPVRLKTGERIEPDGRKSGESNIHLINGNTFDAVVRLVDTVSGKTSRFVYVRAGQSFTMEGMEGGTYLVRVQFGSDWIPACRAFTRDSKYVEYSGPLVFMDDRIRFYDVTLSPILGRKYGTREIDRARFLNGD